MATVGLLMSSCSHQPPAPTPPGPLSQLIGDNGLYVSGESYSASLSSVSIVDTVYDDLTLQDAGSAVPPLLRSSAATAALNDFTTQNPLWGRWFSSAARSAAAQPASVQDTAGLDGFFHKEGFWADSTQKAGDTTGELATTWAALQILARAGQPPGPASAGSVKAWLDQQADHLLFPIQACQLAQSYQVIGTPPPQAVGSYAQHWLTTHSSPSFKDMQALADTYGAACAASLTGSITAAQQRALARTLTPYLGAGSATALQRYYLAQTWLAAGGSRSKLGSLAAAALADLHGTAVSRGHTVLTGGLAPTFFAVQAQKESGYLDLARIPYITRELAKTDPAGDPVDYLAGAASLCALNTCSAYATGIQRATSQLPTTINAQNIDGYLGVVQFLRAVGRTYPATTALKIDTSSPEGMHALVVATAAGSTGDGLTQELSTEAILQGLQKGAAPWDDPSTVMAAATVLADRHALNSATSQMVRDTLSHLRGCAGIQQLYAAQATAGALCDLSTTLGALHALRLLQT